jgi:hypothetical protein
VRVLTPSGLHWNLFNTLLQEGQASGRLVMDAHLAALAIVHGAFLCTTDRDFSRFRLLRTCNPLSEKKATTGNVSTPGIVSPAARHPSRNRVILRLSDGPGSGIMSE